VYAFAGTRNQVCIPAENRSGAAHHWCFASHSRASFRAERRIGELMEAQRDAGLLARPPGSNQHRVAEKPDANPTLSELGIDKNLAARARKMAAIPEAEFGASR
jgi:hypothetical protein